MNRLLAVAVGVFALLVVLSGAQAVAATTGVDSPGHHEADHDRGWFGDDDDRDEREDADENEEGAGDDDAEEEEVDLEDDEEDEDEADEEVEDERGDDEEDEDEADEEAEDEREDDEGEDEDEADEEDPEREADDDRQVWDDDTWIDVGDIFDSPSDETDASEEGDEDRGTAGAAETDQRPADEVEDTDAQDVATDGQREPDEAVTEAPAEAGPADDTPASTDDETPTDPMTDIDVDFTLTSTATPNETASTTSSATSTEASTPTEPSAPSDETAPTAADSTAVSTDRSTTTAGRLGTTDGSTSTTVGTAAALAGVSLRPTVSNVEITRADVRSDLSGDGVPGIAPTGDADGWVSVVATVHNPNSTPQPASVELWRGDELVGVQDVTLDAGGTQRVEWLRRTDDGPFDRTNVSVAVARADTDSVAGPNEGLPSGGIFAAVLVGAFAAVGVVAWRRRA